VLLPKVIRIICTKIQNPNEIQDAITQCDHAHIMALRRRAQVVGPNGLAARHDYFGVFATQASRRPRDVAGEKLQASRGAVCMCVSANGGHARWEKGSAVTAGGWRLLAVRGHLCHDLRAYM
jgi:hypothetical protein